MSHKQKIAVFILLALSGMCGFMVSLWTHHSAPDTPAVMQTFHYPALFVKQLKNDPRAGEKIFKEFCAACHANKPLIDIKAPRIGDRKTWQMIRRQGIENLLKITLHGAGAMPARGGCFECSDEQLRESILYILNQ